jgi:hypothetical protein
MDRGRIGRAATGDPVAWLSILALDVAFLVGWSCSTMGIATGSAKTSAVGANAGSFASLIWVDLRYTKFSFHSFRLRPSRALDAHSSSPHHCRRFAFIIHTWNFLFFLYSIALLFLDVP